MTDSPPEEYPPALSELLALPAARPVLLTLCRLRSASIARLSTEIGIASAEVQQVLSGAESMGLVEKHGRVVGVSDELESAVFRVGVSYPVLAAVLFPPPAFAQDLQARLREALAVIDLHERGLAQMREILFPPVRGRTCHDVSLNLQGALDDLRNPQYGLQDGGVCARTVDGAIDALEKIRPYLVTRERSK